MQRPVLLVIDLLNDFLARWEPQARATLLDATNDLVRIQRGAARPVIWVRQEFEPDLSDALPEMRAKNISTAIRGTPGSQLDARLQVDPQDTVIVKKRYSAFFGTSLDAILQQMEPDVLILAGVNTHACIRTTLIDAYQRDWPVVLAADCIDSYDREHHDSTLKYVKDKMARLMTNEEISAELASIGS